MQRATARAVADRRLSPDEAKELAALAKNLGVTVDSPALHHLERCRLLWQIENAALPQVSVGINLQRNERCFALRQANWHELRVTSRRVQYAGPAVSFRIMKGLYFRAGDLAVKSIANEALKLLDTGTAYVTNKRVVFMGTKRNTSIRLSSILDFTCHANGIALQKASGRSPFLEFSNDVEVFGLILQRVLRDESKG
jgi:hypothetical protein